MATRHMRLEKGTDPTTWPAQIHIKDAYKYIGMSRASWYNTYRKKWNIESMLTEEAGPYIPKSTIKILQERWIGKTFVPKKHGDQSERTEYKYVKEMVDTHLKIAIERAMSEAMPAIMAAVMKAVDNEIPYDEFAQHSDFMRSSSDPFKKFREAAQAEADRVIPDESDWPDHPDQTYLADQLSSATPSSSTPSTSSTPSDEPIDDDLADLVASWETTDDQA